MILHRLLHPRHRVWRGAWYEQTGWTISLDHPHPLYTCGDCHRVWGRP